MSADERLTRAEWEAVKQAERERDTRKLRWFSGQIRHALLLARQPDPGNRLADFLLGSLAMAFLFPQEADEAITRREVPMRAYSADRPGMAARWFERVEGRR